MPKPRLFAAVAGVTALLLLACNSDGTSTAINESVEQFYRALAVDPPRAYTYLSEDCREELPFLEFASGTIFVNTLLGESEPSIEHLRVIRSEGDEVLAEFDIVVYVDGETVPVVFAAEQQATSFVKEDGRWRIASCEDFGLSLVITDEMLFESVPESEAEPSSRYEAAVAAEADDDASLPGEYVDLPTIYGGYYGNQDGPHTAPHTRAKVDYEGEGNSNPPAGGAHWGSAACTSSPTDSPPLCGPVAWGIYRAEWDAESLLHSMEHGGVIIWYNTTDRDVVDEIENIVERLLNANDLIVMAPYLQMEDEHIALTSWSRIDKFPIEESSSDRVLAFLDAHMRRFNPEGF